MEHFAVDLDAVLDEFELNEDQAEVAAARLQKQIELGRLEIGSADVTPAASYTESPRLSSVPVSASPTTPTSHLPDHTETSNKPDGLTLLNNRISVNTDASADLTGSGKHVTSIEIGGGVTQEKPSTRCDEPTACDSFLRENSVPPGSPLRPRSNGTTGEVPDQNMHAAASDQQMETRTVEAQTSTSGVSVVDPIASTTISAETASEEALQNTEVSTVHTGVAPIIPVVNGRNDTETETPDSTVREQLSLSDATAFPPKTEASREYLEPCGGTGSVSAAVSLVTDLTEESDSSEPSTVNCDVLNAGLSAALVSNTQTLVVTTTEKHHISDPAVDNDSAVPSRIHENVTDDSFSSSSESASDLTLVSGEKATLQHSHPSLSHSECPPVPESRGESSSAGCTPPPTLNTASDVDAEVPGIDSSVSQENTRAGIEPTQPLTPVIGSSMPSPSDTDFKTPPQELRPDLTMPEGSVCSVEPVSFQPADEMSDAELDSYLEQLEEETNVTEATGSGGCEVEERVGGDVASATEQVSAASCDTVEAETTAKDQNCAVESAFGGARPKTSPSAAAAEFTPPAPPVVDAGKGSVISRLQSQVSIECVVDNRASGGGGHPAGALDPEETPPPPAQTTRPNSLSLSQPAAEAEPQLSSATAGEDNKSDVDASAESVSTTGGNIVTAPGAYEEARLAATRPSPAPSRGQLVSLSDEDKNLGKVAPVWVPDEEAAVCMECEQKFTVIRRRHHCRACGRVLCSSCCSQRMPLDYMELREGRVCNRCKATMDRVQQEVCVVAVGSGAAQQQRERPPNPNNPMEYCSTVPPSQQATPNAPPPTVMVPTGVLKRAEGSGGRTPSREPKQVMFSDGIRPGGDLSEPPSSPGSGGSSGVSLVRPPHRRTARIGRAERTPAAVLKDAKGCKDLAWKPESGKLPPVYQSGSSAVAVKHSTPEENIVSMMKAERHLPWSFVINKNLMVIVKIFKLDCCVGRTCWMFSSDGLSTVGQEEVLVVLEALPDETTLPRDIFLFYHHLFAEAAKGNFVTELGHTLFSVPFLGSKDHGGFLFLRPTFQCLHNIPAPPQPFLVAVLIQKWEAPWAKVFPLRLLLRLGAEFRYYPCPLVSVRHRKPVFFEVGHTIINLLADFRNFAYVLPTVHGMHIHMEEQQTSVLVPRNRFNQVLKAINNSNDHVLALGASFSREADSHLVCMQNEDGQYQTQAINIQNRPRQVTGASFIVFNGALKSSSGVTAKSSIVEDGLMFQISPDTMQALRASLRQMQDFAIQCGAVGQPPDETITIRWVEDDRSHNLGVRSVIDDRPLDGIRSIRIHSGTDYVAEAKLIRWTELYLIKVSECGGRVDAEPPFSRLAEQVARGTCVALAPHLPLLAESERTRLGLRVTVDSETVGYEAGSGAEALPPACMQLLDSELVPVLHRHAAEVPDSPVCLELLFHVIDR